MSRAAVAPPRGQGPELYWAKAKAFGKAGFTMAELHRRCRGTRFKAIQQYVYALKRAGAVAVLGTTTGPTGKEAFRYTVVRPSTAPPPFCRWGAEASSRGRIQRALWRVMRKLATFLVRELAWLASSPDLDVTPDTAGLYVRRLLKAGLVIVVEPGQRSRRGVQGARPGTYALRPSANTGPEPLRVIGNRVFDPNRGAFVGDPIDGSEVAA